MTTSKHKPQQSLQARGSILLHALGVHIRPGKHVFEKILISFHTFLFTLHNLYLSKVVIFCGQKLTWKLLKGIVVNIQQK